MLLIVQREEDCCEEFHENSRITFILIWPEKSFSLFGCCRSTHGRRNTRRSLSGIIKDNYNGRWNRRDREILGLTCFMMDSRAIHWDTTAQHSKTIKKASGGKLYRWKNDSQDASQRRAGCLYCSHAAMRNINKTQNSRPYADTSYPIRSGRADMSHQLGSVAVSSISICGFWIIKTLLCSERSGRRLLSSTVDKLEFY